MKKILSALVKLFVLAMVGFISVLFSLVLLIGIAEGDLSQGLWYYL